MSNKFVKKSKESIDREYEENFSPYKIDYDKQEDKTYIYTEKFVAESLSTDKINFETFPLKIKSLYNNLFSGTAAAGKHIAGAFITTKEKYVGIVQSKSLSWSNNYPFASFTITDEEKDIVVGYEAIENSFQIHKGRVVALYKHGTTKYVARENAAPLIWGYGYELYKNNAVVNQFYKKQIEKFIGGEPFNAVYATALINNLEAINILESLGFSNVGITNKFGKERCEFVLNYEDFSTDDKQLAGDPNIIDDFS